MITEFLNIIIRYIDREAVSSTHVLRFQIYASWSYMLINNYTVKSGLYSILIWIGKSWS